VCKEVYGEAVVRGRVFDSKVSIAVEVWFRPIRRLLDEGSRVACLPRIKELELLQHPLMDVA
jgi:hypothetical protein